MPKTGTLCHKLRYAPQGRILHWIIRGHGLQLFGLFLVFYVTVSVIFASIYFAIGTPFKDTTRAVGLAFALDCLHFSFVTQATVGYGDIAPIGWARLVAAVQAMLGLIQVAVGLGIVLLKMLNRPPHWVFADNLTYDPTMHQMVAWLWNRDARTFYGASAKILVGRALPLGASARITRRKIETQAVPPSIIPAGRTFLIRAKTAVPETQLSERTEEKLSMLGPGVLRQDDYIQFIGCIRRLWPWII